jgi:hypothetical protein
VPVNKRRSIWHSIAGPVSQDARSGIPEPGRRPAPTDWGGPAGSLGTEVVRDDGRLGRCLARVRAGDRAGKCSATTDVRRNCSLDARAYDGSTPVDPPVRRIEAHSRGQAIATASFAGLRTGSVNRFGFVCDSGGTAGRLASAGGDNRTSARLERNEGLARRPPARPRRRREGLGARWQGWERSPT